MRRFRVKVCGITRPQDAALAASLGADLVGVIFHPGSPRAVSAKQAERLFAAVPAVVHRVGVFVHQPVGEILQIATRLRLDFVQLHGKQTEKEVRTLRAGGFRVIRALDGTALRIPSSAADIIMFDNFSNGHGGTGQPFAWPKRPRHGISNLMLAGGINDSNVEEGVRLFHPIIVDVNSGVESAPGVKSRAKLTRFMQTCDGIRYGN